MRHPIPFRVMLSFVLLVPALAAPVRAGVPRLFPALGFEENVDLVVAPDREFLVVPTESADGGAASLEIYDLNPVDGSVVGNGPATTLSVLGWENGVDPVVVKTANNEYVVVAPTEREDGSAAELLVLRLQSNGTGIAADQIRIPLGNLGFQDEVDPIPVEYPGAIHGVFVPLETEDGSAAAILGVKLDGVDLGRCTVVSTDGRPTGCEDNRLEATGLLTGFVDGVDGVAYPLVDRSRLAMPVERTTGALTADLLFFDFDFSTPHPDYFGVTSVKAANSASARSLPFPGFEREVDIVDLAGSCGFFPQNHRLLVPVQNPGGNGGDLYLVDGDLVGAGVAIWRYTFENPATAGQILGYQEGVDLVPWCNGGGVVPHMVAVPTENQSETEADLLLVDLSNGHFHKSLRRENPAAAIIGYEKGVEPLLWTDGFLLVPEDNRRGAANLLSIDTNAVIQSAVENPATNAALTIFGFERGVDPVVMPVTDPDRTLYVPVQTQNGGDADLLIFRGVPPSLLGPISFEQANPGTVVEGYERDVDPIRVNPYDGYTSLYVPEERESDHAARLRIQPIPFPGPLVALATESRTAALPIANLYFVSPFGGKIDANPDVLGYELGDGPTSGVGDTLTANPPNLQGPPLGLDNDSDNTLTMENSYPGDLDGDGHPDTFDCAPRENDAWGYPVEVSGLFAAKLSTGGSYLYWGSERDVAGPSVVYDVAGGVISQLLSDANFTRAACVADDLAVETLSDPRVPPVGDAFYYFARAQNVCGTGTYGPPPLDTAVTCP